MERIVKHLNLYKELETREIAFTISGSDAYGTSSPDSDIDLRGYWIQPKKYQYGFLKNQHPDISSDTYQKTFELENHTYDIVLHEIGKFAELFSKSNPGSVEWVFSKDDWRYPTIIPEFVRKLQTVGIPSERSFYLGLFGWVKFYMLHTPHRVKSLIDILRICCEAEVYHNKHEVITNVTKSLDMIESKTVSRTDFDKLMELKNKGIKDVGDNTAEFIHVMSYFEQIRRMTSPDAIIVDRDIEYKRRKKINELLIAEREDEYT